MIFEMVLYVLYKTQGMTMNPKGESLLKCCRGATVMEAVSLYFQLHFFLFVMRVIIHMNKNSYERHCYV